MTKMDGKTPEDVDWSRYVCNVNIKLYASPTHLDAGCTDGL